MQTSHDARVSFDDSDTRSDEMHRTIESWLTELSDLVDEAASSEQFRAWLDVQSRFHDYSYRNALLITYQRPDATRVAGFRTWQREFDRQVKKGEKAIWIWAPIIARRCPECGNSPSYHRKIDCGYEETPPEEWTRGLVGFRPAPVFDVSQTEGEPLPELDTAATGEAGDLVSRLLAVAGDLDIEARVVPPDEWTHGPATGVCLSGRTDADGPVVEVQDRPNQADVVVTMLHEFAHALLHVDREDREERSKREIEAEAVAFVVGRSVGLDPSNSSFYLAAWRGEDADGLQERLERITVVAGELIDVISCREPHDDRDG